MTEAEANRETLLGRMLGPYAVLRGNRNLSLLFSGQVVSAFGDWLYVTALVVLAFDLTGSPTIVAAITFVRLLPYVVFLPLSGVLADRGNRKAIMIGSDLGRGACMLGLMLVVSEETLWIAFPLVFAATALSSLFKPAMSSVLPAVVGDEEQLVKANSIWSQMDAMSFVLGPGLGGVLILLGAPQVAFLINGLTFFVSAATLLFVRVPAREAPERAAEEERGWLPETAAGFRFLFRENEGVLAAVTASVAGVAFMGGAFYTLTVVLSEETFGLGGQGTGFLNAAYGAGGLLGGLLAGAVVSRLGNAGGFVWGTVGGSVLAALFGLSPAGVLPFVLIASVGVVDVIGEVTSNTILQTGTPEELLGRVFGAFETVVVSAMLVGALVVGPILDLLGPRLGTVVLSLSTLVVLAACLPRLRRLEGALGVRIFVRQVPVLESLPLGVLDDLASRARLERFPGGAPVVRQGEVGHRLYIVKEGEAEVTALGEDREEVELATLSKNDYFGEIALLRDVPRTATVRARGPLELYSLERDDFRELLERSEGLRASLTGTGDARYVETQNRLLLRR